MYALSIQYVHQTVLYKSLVLVPTCYGLQCAVKTIFCTLSDLLIPSFTLSFSPILYLNNTLFKDNWRPRENYSPLCEKIVSLRKDALSPGGEVPRHYLESAKITERRGRPVIYSTCPNTHEHVLTYTQWHENARTNAKISMLFYSLGKNLGAMWWRTFEEGNTTERNQANWL